MQIEKTGFAWWDAVLLLVTVPVLMLLVTIPLEWQEQLMISGALLALAMWANRASKDYKITIFLMIGSLFCTARYLWYRSSETYNLLSMRGSSEWGWELIFVFALLGAEFYAGLILVLGFFQGLHVLDRKAAPLPADPATWPTVDVFIPTYNEPLSVVKPTVLAALNMDYPADRFRVYVLDDGSREEFADFAAAAGAAYISRSDNKHAKAGNINNALEHTAGDLVAIFDCDHIPTRTFLQMTVGGFVKDERLAVMQTPHYFYSPDPFERNLGIFRKVPNESYLFYGLVQAGNDLWNATLFCGSCAVLRREALSDVGGIAVETLTEDAHTSIRMHREGWNSAYINIPQAAGLATATLADHIGQRVRWARGMVQILRIDLPLLGKGLSLAQRLCYFNSVAHYLYALPRMIFLTAPLVYLLLGAVNIYGYVVTIMAYMAPHLLFATLTNSRIQGRFRHSFWNEVYETVLAPHIFLPTMAALINPKWGKFNVTSKQRRLDRGYLDWRVAMPFVVLFLLNAVGVGFGLMKWDDPGQKTGTLVMNIFWACLNMVNLGAAIAVAVESRQLRASARVPVKMPARLWSADREAAAVTVADLSMGGAMLQMQVRPRAVVGDFYQLSLDLRGEKVVLPATVVHLEGNVMRVAFGQLSLEQEEDLTQVIYSRGDAWVDSRDAEYDRPLSSILTIAQISLRGMLAVPKSLFGFAPSVQPEPRPARPEGVPALAAVSRSASAVSLFVIGSILLALFAIRAVAQPLPPAEVPGAQAFAETTEFRALGQRQTVPLRGLNGQADVTFMLPMTKVATEASLNLRYHPAPGLQLDASSILVNLNGSEVASVSLKPTGEAGSGGRSTISLPSELLMGENTLTFQLAGRCSGCTSAQITELTTLIDPSSSLHISGRHLPLANDLRLLPLPLFDSTVHRTLRMQVAFAGTPTTKALEAAGIVSSWFGAMAEFRGAEFPVSVGDVPSGHTILFVEGVARPTGMGQLSVPPGAGLAVRQNPNDPYSKLLIVYGENGDQLRDAAQMLTMGGPFEGDTAELTAVKVPVRQPYDAPRWLRSGTSSAFHEFALPEQLHVYNTGATRLYFRLAPDLYYGSRVGVPLRVAMRFSGMSDSSNVIVRVKLNGSPVAERKISGREAKAVYSETMQVPSALLYPRNTLAFEFQYLGTAGTGPGPEVRILRESEIDLRGVSHFVEQPRLDLLAKAGYPFTRMADLSQTAIIVPAQRSPELIGMYLDTMAFFGAQTGAPGSRVTVTEPSQVDKLTGKDLLVLGSGQDQPLYTQWGSRLAVQVEGDQPRLLDLPISALDWVRSLFRTGRAVERRRLADALNSEAPVDAVIQGAGSPIDSSRIMILLSTPGTGPRENLVALLDQSAYNEDVYGSVSIAQGGRFVSFRAGTASNFTGELRWRESMEYWMRRYAWMIPLLVVLGGLLVASRLETWVHRQRELRLQA